MNLESTVLQVHIEDIIPNRFQPRLTFDEEGLKELSDSIKEHGIIQPLVLRKLGDKYEIIAGERRFKAAQIAGLTTVPAVIANIDDNKSAEVALVENVQRRDLTAIEEARSYKNLLDKGYLTQDQLAKRMGLSQPSVANKLRLLNLDEEVQQALLDEKISERHARTLLGIEDKAVQREWLHRIINERLTVRQLDLELKKIKGIDSESIEELPLVDSIPSIEEIKANATDIREETKKLSADELMKPQKIVTEDVERLDFGTESSTQVKSNNDLLSDFSTVTKENDSSKFFTFDDLDKEVDAPEFVELSAAQTRMENDLEVFDAEPMETITTEKENETKEIESFESNNFESLNTDFDRNPNNKFFTPVSENIPEVEIKTKIEEDIDPMAALDRLTPEYQEKVVEQSKIDLKDAIASVRKCIEDLGERGMYINVEEIDFDSVYQITIQIHKDN